MQNEWVARIAYRQSLLWLRARVRLHTRTNSYYPLATGKSLKLERGALWSFLHQTAKKPVLLVSCCRDYKMWQVFRLA